MRHRGIGVARFAGGKMKVRARAWGIVVATVLLVVPCTGGQLIQATPAVTDVTSAHSTPAADDEVEDAVDFYGNEVTDAVATYKLDAAGSLYELHSPQTEVPRLASPQS